MLNALVFSRLILYCHLSHAGWDSFGCLLLCMVIKSSTAVYLQAIFYHCISTSSQYYHAVTIKWFWSINMVQSEAFSSVRLVTIQVTLNLKQRRQGIFQMICMVRYYLSFWNGKTFSKWHSSESIYDTGEERFKRTMSVLTRSTSPSGTNIIFFHVLYKIKIKVKNAL